MRCASLSPNKDVISEGARFRSLSCEPWLQIDFNQNPDGGKWFELVFEADFLNAPTRPLLRAIGKSVEENWILPSPVLGRAIWYGRAPEGVEHWLISPTDHTGPFAFRITGVRQISFLARLVLIGRFKSMLMALRLKAFGRQGDVNVYFRRRLLGTPPLRYEGWRDRRRRNPDWAGFDNANDEARRSPRIKFLLIGADDGRVAGIRASLLAAPSTKWSVEAAAPDITVFKALESLTDGDFFTVVGAHDDWFPEAPSVLSANVGDESVDIIYADEELVGPPHSLWCKPAWDPLLARSIDLTGRARLFSVGFARARFIDVPIADLVEISIPSDADLRILHVARILMRATASGPRKIGMPARSSAPAPSVTVIILTRDRADLLRKCTDGLRREASPFEAIIVDNGSSESSALALLSELSADRRFSIIKRPGPFNFSKFCNEAAQMAQTEALLLLNNDTETIAPGWLAELLSWTRDPTIGAVAPKLLFPDGKLQHGGVMLGIGGGAGHFESTIGSEDPGYVGRLNVPFSVSAVTGACLAVSRDKYLAVGGLDEINLPIELNDIDFCLRLAERGWRNMVDGAVTLTHHESASRGTTGITASRYPREWNYFRKRWLNVLRSDPAFPSALSLESNLPALG